MSVYTVGDEDTYDSRLKACPSNFKKLGKTDNYPGGFALKTIEDAVRLIKEFNKVREWAVYELDADWDEDTVKSERGWWSGLQRDAYILRKVAVVNDKTD